MDNSNLRPDQIEALDKAMGLLEQALALLQNGDVPGADKALNDARNAINHVFTGERKDFPGPPV